MQRKTKNVSVALPLDLYEEAKARADEQLTTLPRLFRYLLRLYLNELEAEEQRREQAKS